MAKELRFEKLELQGFGPYQEKTVFAFEEGINTYVASNETGKSTMVYGLLAILFGLPHGSTLDSFDFDRFKNINGDRHGGEILLRVNEVQYGIRRNFQNHEVTLWSLNEQGEKNIVLEGVHNPRAKKPFKAYEKYLVKTLGIGARSLFEDTFFVGQPLPEATAISGNVQSLIIGNRGNSLSSLLDRLVDQLKTVTKYTGPKDLGITARNMGKDGGLEKILGTYEALKQDYGKGKETAEHLVEVQVQLLELEGKVSKDKKLLGDLEKTLEALKTWESLKNGYERVSTERNRLQKLFNKIQEKNRKQEELDQVIQREYSVFNEAGDDLKKDLRRLINEHQKEKELQSTIEKDNREKQQIQEEMKEVQQKLQTYIDWEALGSDPVEKIKTMEKTLQGMKGLWEQLNSHKERLEGLEQLLKNEYTLFEQEEQKPLDLLENYREEYLTRKNELEKAESTLRTEEHKLSVVEDRKEKIRREYNEIFDVSEETIKGIDQKIHLIQEEKKLQQNILQEKDEKKNGALYIPLFGVIFTGIGWLVFDVFGAMIGLVLGVVVGFLIKKSVEKSKAMSDTMRKDINNSKDKILKIDATLGKYSTYDAVELTRLSEMLKQKKRDEESIKEESKNLDPNKLQELQKQFNSKKQELVDFENIMMPYQKTFEAPEQSFKIWKQHKERVKKLQEEIETFYQRIFSDKVEDLAALPFKEAVKDEDWVTNLENLLLIDLKEQFSETMSVRDFFHQAENLDGNWWKEAREKAKTYYELLQQKKNLEHHLNTGEKRMIVLAEKRRILQSELKALELKWEVPLRAYQKNPEKTLESYEHRLEKETKIEQLQKDIKNLLEGEDLKTSDVLENRLALKNDEAGNALGRWKEHIEKFAELPDVSEEYERKALAEKRGRMEEKVVLLSASLGNLETKRLDLRGEKASLEGSNPINLAAAELEIQEMNQMIKKLELRKKALVIAYQEMDRAIKEYRQTYQKNLEKIATSYCRRIMSTNDRSISFGDNMEIAVLEEGRIVPLQSLSKGAKDQVFLSLRFAISDILSEEMKIPFVFDDPFVGTDNKRLARIKETIENEQGERQIFILSHQSQYRNWGKEIQVTRS